MKEAANTHQIHALSRKVEELRAVRSKPSLPSWERSERSSYLTSGFLLLAVEQSTVDASWRVRFCSGLLTVGGIEHRFRSRKAGEKAAIESAPGLLHSWARELDKLRRRKDL